MKGTRAWFAIMESEKKPYDLWDLLSSRFFWFIAGVFVGYLWMAKAYGLFM